MITAKRIQPGQPSIDPHGSAGRSLASTKIRNCEPAVLSAACAITAGHTEALRRRSQPITLPTSTQKTTMQRTPSRSVRP